jgi:flagellar biosynthesis/type III secretory pathway protein FliH
VIEHIPSKLEALSSNSHTTKKEKEKKGRREREREGRKEGREERRRKEEKKKGRKEGGKEGRIGHQPSLSKPLCLPSLLLACTLASLVCSVHTESEVSF